METKLSLPQIIVVGNSKRKGHFLERLTCEAGQPYTELSFSKTNDSRMVKIDYKIKEWGTKDFIYYSETPNEQILTSHIGYEFEGPIQLETYGNQQLDADMFHSKKRDLEEKHLERINSFKDLKKNLDLEEVKQSYYDLFYSLKRYI